MKLRIELFTALLTHHRGSRHAGNLKGCQSPVCATGLEALSVTRAAHIYAEAAA
jgi:hypothetical protein